MEQSTERDRQRVPSQIGPHPVHPSHHTPEGVEQRLRACAFTVRVHSGDLVLHVLEMARIIERLRVTCPEAVAEAEAYAATP